MRFQLSGQPYRVVFRYEPPDRVNRLTVCEILDGATGQEVALGAAECSPQDQFRKAIGRKVAFTRALRRAFPRQARGAVWAQVPELRRSA